MDSRISNDFYCIPFFILPINTFIFLELALVKKMVVHLCLKSLSHIDYQSTP